MHGHFERGISWAEVESGMATRYGRGRLPALRSCPLDWLSILVLEMHRLDKTIKLGFGCLDRRRRPGQFDKPRLVAARNDCRQQPDRFPYVRRALRQRLRFWYLVAANLIILAARQQHG